MLEKCLFRFVEGTDFRVANLDEPRAFESGLPTRDLGPTCARCHAAKYEASVDMGKAETGSLMFSDVEFL